MQLKRVKTIDVYPDEGNPREDMGDLDALAASLELNPARPGEPLNPPLLVQDGGVYRIVDGERRWRAMSMAGTEEFDAVVCEDWADADAALAMLATDDKKPLNEVERSRGVQRALLLGVEPQKVEKAARRKGLKKVKKAAERLGGEAELMSLDHLLAVAELAAMRRVKVVTGAPYCEEGTDNKPVLDTTYDLVFLPSLEEHFLARNESGMNGKEGEAWEYWARIAESGAPLALWKTYPQLITYAINGKTSPQSVWTRSATRPNGSTTFVVYASGNVGNYGAQSALRCAPARAI